MKIVLLNIPEKWHDHAYKAIAKADQQIWGGQMSRWIDELTIDLASMGNPADPDIARGLHEAYNCETRKSFIHAKFLFDQGSQNESNMQWAIVHDLAHAWDICFGNLSFDLKAKTLTYSGFEYKLYQPARHDSKADSISDYFRSSRYYAAHWAYEPWEVRALFMADLCAVELCNKFISPNRTDYLPEGQVKMKKHHDTLFDDLLGLPTFTEEKAS